MPTPSKNESITIVGSGTWGMTLARLFSQAGKKVTLYTHDRLRADTLKKDRKVEKPLQIELPESLEVSGDLGKSLNSAAVVLICVTSQSMRVVCSDIHSHFMTADEEKRPVIVSAVKGLELSTLKRMSEVAEELLPGARICALSGPNLAAEILQGLPTAAVIASHDISIAANVQSLLSVPNFRIYSNSDITGVELGGTLKNVYAIAAGGSDGLKLGANAKAALLTRGLAEMTRVGVVMGAQPSTLAGLAGVGDLLATCAGPLSRNYRMGMELAQGKKVEDIQKEIGGVVEGLTTVTAVCELGQRIGIELPIAELVQKLIAGTIAPDKAIMALMARPLSSE